MNKDMCVVCDDGILNIRVGAIIMKDGKILMVGNDRDYLYSVGGRVKFGETAEEAIVREVLEETGVQMEIDRLGFVHENYFYGDVPSNRNKLIYEISLFFYMKVPDAFAPISESFMEDNSKEHLAWASLDEDIKMYPEFFKTELKSPTDTVKLRMQSEESLRLHQKRLAQAEKRIGELDRLFIRIYEDNVAGRLDDERFAMMSKNYTEEQKDLKVEVKGLQQQIHEQEQQAENIEQFVQRVKRNSTLTELTPYALRELVKAVYVEAPDKSSGKRRQKVHIEYDLVGYIPVDELLKAEQA